MFLKDNLKDAYQKASLDRNNLVLDNVINRWVHRFGVESMNELIFKHQDDSNFIKEDQLNEHQISLKLTESERDKEAVNTNKKKEIKTHNSDFTNKDITSSFEHKSNCRDTQELPLPNINNLRKWINNEKKAS